MRDRIAALIAHNPGAHLALPTSWYTEMIDVDSIIAEGPIDRIINGKHYGYEDLDEKFSDGTSVFVRNTTHPILLSTYAIIYGNSDVVLPRQLLWQNVDGELTASLELEGPHPDYSIVLLTTPSSDGNRVISAVVVNFKDGVQYEMRDGGDSLLDLKGLQSIQLTTKINSQGYKGGIYITRDILEWLMSRDAYVQAQTSKYFLDAAKEVSQFIIEDSTWEALVAEFGEGIVISAP